MMPALPALWQLQGSQPAAVFRGKCTCWGAGAALSFCMNLPDSMGQWSRIKKNETELRERKRKGVSTLIVLAAAGMWMTLLAIMQEFLKARQNVEMFYGEEMKEEREVAKNRQEEIHKH